MIKMKVDVICDIGSTNTKISLYTVANCEIIMQKIFRTPKIIDDGNENFNYLELWIKIKENIIMFNANSLYNICKVVIASVGEMGVLLNEFGDVIGPMIAWYDRRGEKYIKSLSEEDYKEIYRITGLPVHSNYSVFKIKWLCDTYVTDSSISIKWLNLPNYIAFFLTGEKKMEYTLASRTMLLDIKNKQWSKILLKKFCLPFNIMPEIISADTPIGRISGRIKKELNFLSDVSVNSSSQNSR